MDIYDVSRETFDRLKLCQQELNEWQKKFNLVSNNSLEDSWNRHFLDSAQLFPLIPQNANTLADLGSGAGFPGMIIALMAMEKTPYLKVTLIESITKKTLYLKNLAEKTSCSVEILNQRVEQLKGRKFDVITARAMTALADLLKYANPLMKKNTVCIFPKGKSYLSEIEQAQKLWNFDYEVVPSQTNEESVILLIRHIVKKGR